MRARALMHQLTIRDVLPWVRDNVIQERHELFMKDGTVYVRVDAPIRPHQSRDEGARMRRGLERARTLRPAAAPSGCSVMRP